MNDFWKQYFKATLFWCPIVCAIIELASGNFYILGENFYPSLFISIVTATYCIFLQEFYIFCINKTSGNFLAPIRPVGLRHKFIFTAISLSPGLYLSNAIARYFFSNLKPMNSYSFLFSGYFYASIIILILYFTYTVAEFKKSRSKFRAENQFLKMQMQELEIENLKAKLNSLSSQINPHFLFNSLNSIAATIDESPQVAEKMVVKLSDLYRRILIAAKKDFHSLEEEISICTDYINIEKIRFENRLIPKIQTGNNLELKTIQIPVLLIQTLIENSIKHGIAPKINGGEVLLSITRVGRQLEILVKDQGINHDSDFKNNETSGLKDSFKYCKQRLSLIYPDRFAFKADIGQTGSLICIYIDLEVPA